MKKLKIAVVYFLFIIILCLQFCCMTNVYAATDSKIWDGTVADSFDSGSGTSSDPYIIKTAPQLALLSKNVNNGNSYKDKYFRLEDNIILNDTSKWGTWTDAYGPKNEWTQIGYFKKDSSNFIATTLYGVYTNYNEAKMFSGNFDGNGHIIRGVYCVNEDRSCGLFGANKGTIKNLGVVQSYIKGRIGIGGIVGKNEGIVSGCYFWGNIESFDPTTILTVSNKSEIILDSGVGIGGIAGINAKTVLNCYSKGKFTGTQCVGGIVGLNQLGSVDTCISTAYTVENKVKKLNTSSGTTGSFINYETADALEGDCGQIVGYAINNTDKNIKNCYSINDIKNSYGTKIDKNKAGDKASYSGFDFTSIWTSDVLQSSGMPTLLNIFDYYDHDHKQVWVTTEQPTCSKSGIEQKRCEICNEYLSEQKQISATGVHTPGEYITQINSACYKNGKKVQKCTVCSTVLNEQSLDPLEHEVVLSERAATCVENGKIKKICKLCNTLIESEEIPATGHTSGEFEIAVIANCETEGEKQQKCVTCGEVLNTEKIPAIGHTAGEFEITVVADCKTAGEKQQKCVTCGEVVNTEQIALEQHIMGEWQLTQKSTMLSSGRQMRECTVCGQTEYEDIPRDTKSLTVMICCAGAAVVIGVGIAITIIIKKKKI